MNPEITIQDIRNMPMTKLNKVGLIKMIDALCVAGEALRDQMKQSEEQRLRLVSQRTLDETKIHQLQTALDGAVRARTQALEEVQQLRQRSWREDTQVLQVGNLLQANLKDLREAMALLTRVIK